jgi:hypothetical protein
MKKMHTMMMFLFAALTLIASTQARAACSATTWDLTAGQTINVGTVKVSNDSANLYITYTLAYPGATLGNLHMWVGDHISLVPSNKQGIPVPGQFPWKVDATGLTASTLAIPLTALGIVDESKVCGMSLFVVTHAEVSMDSDHDGQKEDETAFGGDTSGSGPRWWFYGAYSICCQPQYTLIKLKTFTSGYLAGRVTLRWTTASEFENAGFFLLRSEDADGDYERLNSHVIPAKGTSLRGASYTYTDKGGQRKKTYYYKLEDVDTHGTSTFHGPIQVKIK